MLEDYAMTVLKVQGAMLALTGESVDVSMRKLKDGTQSIIVKWGNNKFRTVVDEHDPDRAAVAVAKNYRRHK